MIYIYTSTSINAEGVYEKEENCHTFFALHGAVASLWRHGMTKSDMVERRGFGTDL